MGFLTSGDTEVSITSRFTNKREKDYFLEYMLFRTFHINILDINQAYSDDGFFDIFVLLFPRLLKDALRKGVYRAYTRNEYNPSSPRGAIDVKCHLGDNISFLGKAAWTVRQQCDRAREACDRVHRESSLFRSILAADNETKESVRIIRECTPSCKLDEVLSVMKANRNKVLHPCYMECCNLQKL